jgi:hypothetical protein
MSKSRRHAEASESCETGQTRDKSLETAKRRFRFSLRAIATATALVAAVIALLAPMARKYFAPKDPQSEFDELVELIETTVTPITSGGEALRIEIDP